MSFVLRHTYSEPLERAILRGWTSGTYQRDFLFYGLIDGDGQLGLTSGFIAPELSAQDFVLFDYYHALDEGVHKRIIARVEVVRKGRVEQVSAHVYVAGPSFHKVRGGRFL